MILLHNPVHHTLFRSLTRKREKVNEDLVCNVHLSTQSSSHLESLPICESSVFSGFQQRYQEQLNSRAEVLLSSSVHFL